MKLVFASLLSCIAPLTTEVFAPAMRFAEHDLGMQRIEESVCVFLAMSAAFHIFHGYLIEKTNLFFVSFYALALYTLTSSFIACNAPVPFLILRLFQGLGASGCTVCGFACVRMYLEPKIHIPKVNFIRSLVLIIAPMVSELIIDADMYRWRSSFIILVATGLIGLILTLCTVSQKPEYRLTRTNVQDIYRFVIWCSIDACGFAAMFIWIAYAPFLRDTPHFGYLYGITFVGSACGSLFSKYFRPKSAVMIGNLLVILMSILCMLNVDSNLVFLFMTCSNFARGISGAHAQSTSLKYASSTGKLAGIFHFVRMALTSLCVYICSFSDYSVPNQPYYYIPWFMIGGLCSVSMCLVACLSKKMNTLILSIFQENKAYPVTSNPDLAVSATGADHDSARA